MMKSLSTIVAVAVAINAGLFARLCIEARGVPFAVTTSAQAAVPGPGRAFYSVHELTTDASPTTEIYHGGGINDQGQLATTIDEADIWLDGKKHALPLPPGISDARAIAINAAGDVTGYASATEGQCAIVWRHGDYQPQVLPSIPGFPNAEATAINDAGDVAGRVFQSAAAGVPYYAVPSHAVIWHYGKPRDLGVPPGCLVAHLEAINNSDQAAGWTVTRDQKTHGCAWDGHALRDLGTLPGGQLSKALCIDDNGDIIGDADTADSGGNIHMVMWRQRNIIDLGEPPHRRESNPKAMSHNGIHLGDTDGMRPYIWDAQHGTRLIEVDDPNVYIQRAIDVNDSGDILALGVRYDINEPYDHRMFLLTPKN